MQNKEVNEIVTSRILSALMAHAGVLECLMLRMEKNRIVEIISSDPDVVKEYADFLMENKALADRIWAAVREKTKN